MRVFYGMGLLLFSGLAWTSVMDANKKETDRCVKKIKSFNTYLTSVGEKVGGLSRGDLPSCDLRTSLTEENYRQCLKQLSGVLQFLKDIQSRVKAEFKNRGPKGFCPAWSDLPFARELEQQVLSVQLKLKALRAKSVSAPNQSARRTSGYEAWKLKQCLLDVGKVVQSSLSLSARGGDMYLVFQDRAAFRVHRDYVTWLSESCLQNLPEPQSLSPEVAQLRKQVQDHQNRMDQMLKKSEALLSSSKKRMCQNSINDSHLALLCEAEELVPSLAYSLHLAVKTPPDPKVAR